MKTLRQQSKKSLNAVYQNSNIWKWIQIQNICCCAVIKIHSWTTDLWSMFSWDICWGGEKEPQPNKGRQAKKSSPCNKRINTDMASTTSWNAAIFLNTGQRFDACSCSHSCHIISTLLAGLDAVAVTHLGYHNAAGEILLWTTVCST